MAEKKLGFMIYRVSWEVYEDEAAEIQDAFC